MRKIIASVFVSVDGVAEAPEKWMFPYLNEEAQTTLQAGMDAADTMLLGRRTYQEFAAYWPTASKDPIAPYMNQTPKVVVSTTLRDLPWRPARLIGNNVASELTKMKQQPGKNIGIVGSLTLVRSLLRDGVLDELALMVFPILVGKGKRLFEDWSDTAPLELADSRTFTTGALSLLYRRA